MTSTLEGPTEHTGVPQRTCVVCRRQREKTQLFRIARTPEGTRPDPAQRMPGRGAYVCREAACVERLHRRRGGPLRGALPGTNDDEARAVTAALAGLLESEHQRSNA